MYSGYPDYSSSSKFGISVGNTSTQVLAANTNRRYAVFINDSDETIYLAFGEDAAMNEGIRLNAAGGCYELSHVLGNLNNLAVNAICSSGSKVCSGIEGE